MGVLSRKRSLLVKLAVVVTTAWFTVAFLLYSENQSGAPAPVALSLQEDVERFNRIEEVEVQEREEPMQLPKKESNSAVLAPPQNLAGEMGKPVILPANLTGEFFWLLEVSELLVEKCLPDLCKDFCLYLPVNE